MGNMTTGNIHDVQYKHWVASIGLEFTQDYSDVPLFTTNAGSALWDTYINHFPVSERDYHRCSHCQQFIERYGSLVTIRPNGSLVPVMWDVGRVPSAYRASVSAMVDILRGSSPFRRTDTGKWKGCPEAHQGVPAQVNQGVPAQVEVTGVFISSKKVWGTPPSDTWRHYHVVPPIGHVHNGWGIYTAKQRASLFTENYQLLQRALNEYYREPDYPLIAMALANAHRNSKLRGSLTCGGAPWLTWLYNLTQKVDHAPPYHQNNVVWLAATDLVPLGYFHIKGSIAGRYLNRLLAQRNLTEDTVRED